MSLNFEVFINDENFDNFDNSYAKIMLHKYTNMKNARDIEYSEVNQLIDEVVELRLCDDQNGSKYKLYCPNYSWRDFMYANQFEQKHSWYRLVVHRCDQKVQDWSKQENCKSDNQVLEYFMKKSVHVNLYTYEP